MADAHSNLLAVNSSSVFFFPPPAPAPSEYAVPLPEDTPTDGVTWLSYLPPEGPITPLLGKVDAPLPMGGGWSITGANASLQRGEWARLDLTLNVPSSRNASAERWTDMISAIELPWQLRLDGLSFPPVRLRVMGGALLTCSTPGDDAWDLPMTPGRLTGHQAQVGLRPSACAAVTESCSINPNASSPSWMPPSRAWPCKGSPSLAAILHFQRAKRPTAAIYGTHLLSSAAALSFVSAGDGHTCAVLTSGALQCWGYGYNGRLGTGGTANEYSPVAVLAGGVASVSAGGSHTCAVLVSGALQCWGRGWYGRLGTGDTANEYSPVTVLAGGVASVSAGREHTCAVLVGGLLQCCGYGEYGQLGTGGTDAEYFPVAVIVGGVTSVSAGEDHTCAVLVSGALQCWGRGWYGRLGTGLSRDEYSPVTVVVGGLASVSAGGGHTCAVLVSGSLQCWGKGYNSGLGTGGTANEYSPVTVLAGGVASVSAGEYHTCAVLVSGALQCWGRGPDGQLGTGGTDDEYSPVTVLAGGVASVSAGREHTCAVLVNGTCQCWGYSLDGRLGSRVQIGPSWPSVPAPSADMWSSWITAGGRHTCAVLVSGALQCWGYGYSGQLGTGGTAKEYSPVTVIAGGVASVSSGESHTCAVLVSGALQCWGGGWSGQLGTGGTANEYSPAAMIAGGVASVSAGGSHTCAVLVSGVLQCWGGGEYGQLGTGGTANEYSPVTVLAGGVASVSAGEYHTCAVLVSDALQCWGRGADGQLGTGGTDDEYSPVTILPAGVASVSAGESHTCAVLVSGALQCWGEGSIGQLGTGLSRDEYSPVTVLAGGVASVSAGEYHTCAVLVSGALQCWGMGQYGQLGIGSSAYEYSPVTVLAGGVASVSAGGVHTCAVLSGGALQCWGAGWSGQLGSSNGAVIADPAFSPHLHAVFAPLRLGLSYQVWSGVRQCLVAGSALPFVKSALPCADLDRYVGHAPLQPRDYADKWHNLAAVVHAAREFESCHESTDHLGCGGGVPIVLRIGEAPGCPGGYIAFPEAMALGMQREEMQLNGSVSNCTVGHVARWSMAIAHLQPGQGRAARLPLINDFGIHVIPSTSETITVLRAAAEEFGLLSRAGGRIVISISRPLPTRTEVQVSFKAVATNGAEMAEYPCLNAAVDAQEVRCDAPAGSGTVEVSLLADKLPAGGTAAIVYQSPVLVSVAPSQLVAHAPGSNATSTFNITVRAVDDVADVVEAMTVSIGAASCARLAAVDAKTIACTGLRLGDVVHSSVTPPNAVSQVDVTLQVGAQSDTLPQAVRATVSVLVLSVDPLSVSVAGQRVTVRGIGFGRPGSEDGLPASGDVHSVTLGPHGVVCSGINVISDDELTCAIPPGVGMLSPVTVERVGGINGSANVEGLQYAVPVVTGASPDTLYSRQALPGIPVCVDLVVHGRNFGHPGSSGNFNVTVGGSPCAVVTRVSDSRLECQCVDASALDISGTVNVAASFAPVSGSAAVEVVPLPKITEVVPSQVAAVGGDTVTVFGKGFAGSQPQHQHTSRVTVLVNNRPCESLFDLSPVSVKCRVPPLADAAAALRSGATSKQVGITVTVSSGESHTTRAPILTFALPAIVLVEGASLSAAAPSSAHRWRDLTVQGPELIEGHILPQELYMDLNSTALFANCTGSNAAQVVCRISCPPHAILRGNATAVGCSGLDMSQLMGVVRPGESAQLALSVRTASGLLVRSQPGSVRVSGPPLLTAAVPAAAEVNDTVSLQGAALGYALQDIIELYIGRVQLNMTSGVVVWNGPESMTITALPPPASKAAGDVRKQDITVVTRFGTRATLVGGFSWILPAEPPVTAPAAPCAYRDEAGTAHVAALWPAGGGEVTRVNAEQAWVVTSAPLSVGSPAGTVTSTVPVTSSDVVHVQAAGDALPALAGLCPHLMRRWEAGTYIAVDVAVRSISIAGTSPPVRLSLAASTATDTTMAGPASAPSPPLFAPCESAPGPAEQYLATQYATGDSWEYVVCAPCPPGALCRGLPYEAMENAPGWQRAEWDPLGLTFVQCALEASCPRQAAAFDMPPALGNVSLGVVSAYVDPSGQWAPPGGWGGSTNSSMATTAMGTCAEGHRGHLCKRCDPGWGRDVGDTCTPCATAGLQWLALLGGMAVVLVVLGYMIRTTLQGTAEAVATGVAINPYVGVNKVLFTHLQQIAIAASFPMAWPPALLSMFAVFDTSASVSSDLVAVDCFQWNDSAFIAGVATQLLLPLVLTVGIVLFWGALHAAAHGCQRSSNVGQVTKHAPVQPNKPASGGSGGNRRSVLVPAVSSVAMPNPLRVNASSTSAGSGSGPSAGSWQSSAAQSIFMSRSARVNSLSAPSSEATSAGSATQPGCTVPTCLATVQSYLVTSTPAGQGIIVSLLVSAFLLHLGLTKTSLSALTCVQLAPGRSYLLGDLDIACGSQEHTPVMSAGIVGLLLYGFGIPLGSTILLWQRRARLQSSAVKARYGFLYMQYKPAVWYWETVTLLRKVLLAVVAVLLAPQGTGVQVLCSSCLLMGALLLHVKASPHVDQRLNTLEACSLVVAIGTLSGGAVLVDDVSTPAWKMTTTVAIVGANVVFLAATVVLLVYLLVTDEELRGQARAMLASTRASAASVSMLVRRSMRKTSGTARPAGQQQ